MRVKDEKGALKVRVLMNRNAFSTMKGFHLAERKLKRYQIRRKGLCLEGDLSTMK